ncbi:hypothetical protein ACSBR2_005260 [Camellia fascicularis]
MVDGRRWTTRTLVKRCESRVTGGDVDFVGMDDCFLGDDKQPNLSLSLARQCLFNALYLLNRSESKCSNSDSPRSSTLEENESGEVTSSNNTNYRSGSGGDSKASNLMA